MLIIAHRIIVRDKGRFVEAGAHEAPLAKPHGLYAHPWAMQDGGQPTDSPLHEAAV